MTSRTCTVVLATVVAVVAPTGARAQCCAKTSGCFCDLGNGTIKDTCTGRQWEKKTTTAGLHNVNNRYSWAGQCAVGGALCQPNVEAAATCGGYADGGTQGCSTCGSSGPCNVDVFGVGAITTVWDWINQVNAANYAGHSDWRLPSEGGQNSPATGSNELETILLGPYPCGTSPCINSIFGPTVSDNYWSASTTSPADLPGSAWDVSFSNGSVSGNGYKPYGSYVRAVR